MIKKREIILDITQYLIIILIVLSIYGAFLGAERASVFFNSPPMILFWFMALAFIVCGFVSFPSLRKKAALAMVHIGAVLVILGGMWGSEKASALQRDFLGMDKIHSGRMLIYEGGYGSKVYLDMKTIRELPFSIMLKDFIIEYYPTGQVKKFISEVEVVENGGVVKEFNIEVNKPLHYGGYHFYQFGYDEKDSNYTILSVSSDTGSYITYSGFIILLAGIFGLSWFRSRGASGGN